MVYQRRLQAPRKKYTSQKMLVIVKDEQYDFLKEQAEVRDMSLSALVRRSIDLLMEEHKNA